MIDIARRAKFIAARVFVFIVRIASLRVAHLVFRNASQTDVLKRRFYGLSIYLQVGRGTAQQLLWLEGKRFVKERRLLKKLVRPGAAVIDVGANIGYYALLFASYLKQKGTLLCLEPEPDNLKELEVNVLKNRLEALIEIDPSAAGDYDGELKFECGLNGRVDPQGSLTVTVKRIDSLLLERVHLIKVDVEGFEGAVLEGARETISRFRPNLLVELHPRLLTRHTHNDIVELLRTYYPAVEAYRPRREKTLVRLLMAYLQCIDPTESFPVAQINEHFVDRGEPCWIVATK